MRGKRLPPLEAVYRPDSLLPVRFPGALSAVCYLDVPPALDRWIDRLQSPFSPSTIIVFSRPRLGPHISKAGDKKCKSEPVSLPHSQPPRALHPQVLQGQGAELDPGLPARVSLSAAGGTVPTWGALQAGAPPRALG